MRIELSIPEISLLCSVLQKEYSDCQRLVKRAKCCNMPEIEIKFQDISDSIQEILKKLQET